MIDFCLFGSGPSLAVIPVVAQVGPMLIAVLSAVLAALIRLMITFLKPSTMKAFVKVMWRNKVVTVIFVAVIAGMVHGGSYVKRALADRRGGGAVEAGKNDWSAFRGGLDRRGATLDAEDPTAPARIWSGTTAIKTFYSSPGIVGNRIYATTAELGLYSDRGGIVCLDTDTGEVVWNYSPKGFRATYSSPSNP